MAKRSAYDIFRTRIAPIAFIVALAALATQTCRNEMSSVTFYFDFGSRGAVARTLEVEIFRGDDPEPVGRFQETFSATNKATRSRWKTKLDSGTYRLEIRVATDRKTHRFSRSAEVKDGAAITVPLEDSLPLP